MRASLLCLFVISLTSSIAQTPCVDGFAGEYPCDRIDLQSFMSLADLGSPDGVNDIWGWTDPIDGSEYALVGMVDGTAFVNITDPVNPLYLGELPTHTGDNNTWRDIKVNADHAYIVSEQGGHGIQIFDLTRLRDVTSPPEIFTEDSHYNGLSNCHNLAMNEATGYAYPVGAGSFSNGPHFLNLQDPLNPVLEGGFDAAGYCHDAQIVIYNGPDADYVGQEIYIGFHGNNSQGLVILDVTDKSDPELIQQLGYDCQDYTHQGWLTPDQRYCIVCDELDELEFGYNTRTRIFNVEDLDNPILVGNYISDFASTDHQIYTHGNYGYLSSYSAGLRVLDYSLLDEGIIDEVAFFDVFPAHNNVGFEGSWSNYPYFPSGNIVVTNRASGLLIVKLQDMTGVLPSQLINTEICPAEVSVSEFEIVEFTISPNPATQQVTLNAEVDIERIDIYDISGRVVLTESVNVYSGGSFSLDIDGLAEGAYIIAINNNLKAAKRLIVE